MSDDKPRFVDDTIIEYTIHENILVPGSINYKQLGADLAEWKLRALTAESMEEDAQQAAARFKAERDKLRVLLLRADEALCMAIDIDDPNLSPSERDWIITQARGVHGDIRAALQEGEA